MKRGVHFRADPKIVSTRGDFLARVGGFGRWQHIRTGALFDLIPHGFQRAVLLHEEGHIRLGHLRARALLAWRFITFRASVEDIRTEAHRQELEADRYAAERGYAHQLAGLARLGFAPGPWHPSVTERIENLKEYL